ncbi:MAG TPA: decaprenyl-phosphate phosphoribosyltransferase [Solirubrobacteraceae bacterium]|nr:decaprenyl-phosphate phosphoribosyltransferase [Solirubrobacteraceae bacterium]
MVASAVPVTALLRLARPKQWTKNFLVVAAALAAGSLGHHGAWLKAGLAFIAFCAIASGIYALNDVRDRHEDAAHPTKCRRPIASGEVSPSVGGIFGACLIAGGLLLTVTLPPLVTLVAQAYVVLTLTYTLIWRHIVVLDLFSIAGGFVLRAVAGGVAVGVPLSVWFLLVITFAAVMVAAGKRDSELARVRLSSRQPRAVLRVYTHRTLRALMVAACGAAMIAYVLWALAQSASVGFPWRLLTAVPFGLAMARYLVLARAGASEAPDELLLHDRPMLGAAGLWLIVFALGVSAGA